LTDSNFRLAVSQIGAAVEFTPSSRFAELETSRACPEALGRIR